MLRPSSPPHGSVPLGRLTATQGQDSIGQGACCHESRSASHNTVLLEGTIIETVLTNRLDSSFSGPVNCMVTTDVYAHDHQTLLIPRGTRILGEVRKLETLGEQRLAVIFHRLIMPDGSSVSLDQFKGLDQIGQTGLLDQVNHHYLQIFGVSLAIGAIAGLSQATTRYGLDESGAQAYEQGVAGSLSQSSLHILDRYLNVLPTFTVREGHRIKVYLSQDLLLPSYGEHPRAISLKRRTDEKKTDHVCLDPGRWFWRRRRSPSSGWATLCMTRPTSRKPFRNSCSCNSSMRSWSRPTR